MKVVHKQEKIKNVLLYADFGCTTGFATVVFALGKVVMPASTGATGVGPKLGLSNKLLLIGPNIFCLYVLFLIIVATATQ
jgi:hypothetical protein